MLRKAGECVGGLVVLSFGCFVVWLAVSLFWRDLMSSVRVYFPAEPRPLAVHAHGGGQLFAGKAV